MVRIILNAEEVKVCSGCNEVIEDGDEVTVYECNDCGTTFIRDDSADGSSNRCPDCNKFAAKSDEVQSDCCQESLAIAYKVEGEGGELVFLEDDVEVEPDPAPTDPAITAMNERGATLIQTAGGYKPASCPKCKRAGVVLRSIKDGGDYCPRCGWKEKVTKP